VEGREYLAVMLVIGSLGGAYGAAVERAHNINAGENVRLAEGCYDAYGNDKTGQLDADTIECMAKGWIPHLGSIDSIGFNAGEPIELFHAYIEEERAKADDFDEGLVAVWAGIGVIGGLMLSIYRDGREEKKRDEEQEAEAKKEPETDGEDDVLAIDFAFPRRAPVGDSVGTKDLGKAEVRDIVLTSGKS
jgi:hypothetical protein